MTRKKSMEKKMGRPRTRPSPLSEGALDAVCEALISGKSIRAITQSAYTNTDYAEIANPKGECPMRRNDGCGDGGERFHIVATSFVERGWNAAEIKKEIAARYWNFATPPTGTTAGFSKKSSAASPK
jgi:hypothetical protein